MQQLGEEGSALSEFEEKLNAILSNPEAMAQVMGLAQSLNGSGAFSGGQEQGEPQSKAPPGGGEHPAGGMGNLGNLGDLFSRIDPKMIERLLPLMNGLFETTNPILVKEALALDGFPVGGVRLPLVDATPEQSERLAAIMREVGEL